MKSDFLSKLEMELNKQGTMDSVNSNNQSYSDINNALKRGRKFHAIAIIMAFSHLFKSIKNTTAK